MSTESTGIELADKPTRGAEKFFDALDAADARVHQTERAEWTATFAPPIRSYAACSCGRTFECRDDQIRLTDDERTEAVAEMADMLGRSPLDDLDRVTVDRVIAAINTVRVHEDHAAMRDFQDAHAYCGDDR
jgi:hypothetical protein